jgi:mono/diheme cytochrome c family protein
MKTVIGLLLLLPFVSASLAAEHEHHSQGDVHPGPLSTVVNRSFDRAQVARGETIYTRHCASCHGARGEGAPQWRQRGADGKLPAPPLDGSGHAWHHPMADLIEMINEGSRPGEGNMPGWKGKLGADEVNAVIAWFQSLWNDDIHEYWQQIDRRAREGGL